MDRKRNGTLVYFAMLTMLIDHVGLLFFPGEEIYRSIGRLAFPIFAWGIAQGFKFTKDRRAYFRRLLLFALISQPPYMFLTLGLNMRPLAFNQIAQFVLTFMVLALLEKAREKKGYYVPALVLIFLPDTIELFVSEFSIGYGTYGILMSVLFYYLNSPLSLGFGYLALSLYGSLSTILTWYGYPLHLGEGVRLLGRYLQSEDLPRLSNLFFQWRSAFSLPFLWFKDKLPYLPYSKWIAYVFYPLHMIVLLLLYGLLYRVGVL